MSEEERSTLTGFVISLMGGIILTLGVIVVYFSFNTDVGIVDPRSITPFGVAMAVLGGLMLLAKKA